MTSGYDYSYERTDEQLLYYSALPAIAKLRWLDDAWHFTMMTRGAERTYFRDGRPAETFTPRAREVEPRAYGSTPGLPGKPEN